MIFNRKIFSRLCGINYHFNDKEYATINIAKNQKNSGIYFIEITEEKAIKLNARNKTGFEFDIWINDEKYEYIKPKRLISVNPAKLYKSDKNEIKYQYNGYGIMVYKNEDFVGRINPNYNFFTGRAKYAIDFIDFNSVDFLVSLCTIEILQNYIYKVHETGA
jgi:hypothetical protein